MMIRRALSALVSVNLLTRVLSNPSGCVDSVDPNEDLFPDKVKPTASVFWKVVYENTYKVAMNLATNQSYLLYPCGSEAPSNVTVDSAGNAFAGTFSIPLTDVALTETPMIDFIEQLGLLDQVKAFLSDTQYISSSCFLNNIKSGDILTVKGTNNATGAPILSSKALNLSQLTAFADPFTAIKVIDSIAISNYLEITNDAIFEWIKFYSVFFNKEDLANTLVQAAAEKYECLAETAGRVQSDAEKPLVLWAYYSDYCGGWDIAKCPNYYCEFASACSANILSSTEGNITACGGYTYMSLDQIVDIGKDADYWIFPAPNWEATYDAFKARLDTMKSVQNKKVFDYLGMGENAWFEQRYSEYYDVLQDVCSIVGTTRGLSGPGWFRNVFTQSPGSVPACGKDGREPLLSYNLGSCGGFDPDSTGTNTAGTDTTGTNTARTDTTGTNTARTDTTGTDTTGNGESAAPTLTHMVSATMIAIGVLMAA